MTIILYPENERKKGEIFVGNTYITTRICERLAHLNTLRMGEQAYSIYGEKLPAYVRPLFVHKSEYAAYNAAYDDMIRDINMRRGQHG